MHTAESSAPAPTSPEPDWLAAWRGGSLTPADALARFDALPGLAPQAMLGRWRGEDLATGHVFDGLLGPLGWWGKAFESAERVHPLLFRAGDAVVPVEPALMPTGAALRWPRLLLPRTAPARAVFRALLPLLRARRPGARLELRTFRGRESAAMVYLRQPIVDHFRRIDDRRVLGAMERTGMAQPFFFLLTRDDDAAAGTAGA